MQDSGNVAATLKERGSRYGDFMKEAAIAQAIINTLDDCRTLRSMPEHQAHALRMIAVKLARILNGDPNYDDNWRDIAGYATLVLDRLPKGD